MLKILKKLFDKANKFIERSKLSGLIIGFISFIFVFLFSLTSVYERFELSLYDIKFKIKPSIPEFDLLTFIDVDENSITKLGEFPWTRDKYADGISILNQLGVRQTTLDIMFPDESPLQINKEALNRLEELIQKKKKISNEEFEKITSNNDKIFADSIAKMNKVIIPYSFNNDLKNKEVIKREKSSKFIKSKERFLDRATILVSQDKIKNYKSLLDKEIKSISYPIPVLMNSALSFGFVNRYTDIDGSIRKVKLVRLYENRLYFNLAIAMLIDLCNVSKNNIIVQPGNEIILKNAFNPVTHQIKDIHIPIDDKGMMYVNWAGPGPREKSFHLIPFYTLLEYKKKADEVHDYFDSDEAGNIEKAHLYNELRVARKEYAESKKYNEKQKIWNKIIQIKKNIKKFNEQYSMAIANEIAIIENSLKKSNDPLKRKELNRLKKDRETVDMVIMLDSISDHITITGLTATGTPDIGAVPLHKEYARVGTYVNTVNTILNNGFIIKTGMIFNFLLMLFISLFIGFLIQQFSARNALLTIAGAVIFGNIIAILIFSYASIWIEQVGMSLALLLPSIVIASIKFINEENQKRFIKSAFSRYLSSDVIEKIIENPESLRLGGENKDITIFFSDVAGFTSISEKLTPPDLVKILNEYLSEMTVIIQHYGGTVDKYIGDAIMAFYGAPHQFDDHSLRAVLAAIDMKKRLRELQEDWRKQGRDELQARMGINTGAAVVGNIGSESRVDYTAIGDSVNLASRLEGANKIYSTAALISEQTYEGAKDHIEARRLDSIKVKGKSEAILIYELIGKKGTLPDKMYTMLDKYNNGLEHFRTRQWKRAIQLFKEGLQIIPDDGPCKLYIKRSEEYIKKAPPKNWDGVYTLTSK